MIERKLLDFYADWCGPCKLMEPVVESVKQKLIGQLLVEKVNVDSNWQMAQSFGVRSIPTFIALEDGVELGRLVGAVRESTLLDYLNKTFNNFK